MSQNDTAPHGYALITNMVTVREFDAHKDEEREDRQALWERFGGLDALARATQNSLMTLAERQEATARFVKVVVGIFGSVSTALVVAGIVAVMRVLTR